MNLKVLKGISLRIHTSAGWTKFVKDNITNQLLHRKKSDAQWWSETEAAAQKNGWLNV